MEAWQIILAVFLAVLPLGLMVDFWGDERLTFRGRPVTRPWRSQIDHPAPDEHH